METVAGKKIILADVAAKMNISKMTVSRALNGLDGVGDELCREIRLTAEEMGYRFTKLRSERELMLLPHGLKEK